MLLYVGPDQIIPLTTLVSTLTGLVVIFWGEILLSARKISRWFSERLAGAKKSEL